MLDLRIDGATVIDGTGAPGRVAMIGVSGGRVVSIGETGEPARTTVDADGLVLCPGFVDLHTHYDAQLWWDPSASPSPLHGVTTAIGGNCGFGLAPAGPRHADYIMQMMARVEGMPLVALQQGLPWDWDGFGDWLGRLDGRIGINAGFLAGHSTLRRAVLGDETGRPATRPEIEGMVALLHDALAAGALGFSTSGAPTHHDGDGRPVPSRAAEPAELLALAGAVAPHPGTTVELILAGCLNGFTDDEIDLMAGISRAAGRPVNWNVLAVNARDPEAHRAQLAASDRAAASGARVVALTLPQAMRIRLSFLSGFVLDGLPGWRDVFALPVEDRLVALADPEVRARLEAGARSEEAGILRGLAQWEHLELAETFSPATEPWMGRRVGEVAAATGLTPFDALLDVVGQDRLRTALRPPGGRLTPEDWGARVAVWRDHRAIIGGSDAGAHLDMMCGATYTTAVLAGVREFGQIPLEEAVRLLSDVPARFYGLRDRGRIEVGACADLVAFDPATVGPGPERTLDDLPGGASRVYAGSTGVVHVWVNGVRVVADGAFTGATPGTVLRSGRDTDTVSIWTGPSGPSGRSPAAGSRHPG